jgi:hypothetical protein
MENERCGKTMPMAENEKCVEIMPAAKNGNRKAKVLSQVFSHSQPKADNSPAQIIQPFNRDVLRFNL